jgi:hypothetical protein
MCNDNIVSAPLLECHVGCLSSLFVSPPHQSTITRTDLKDAGKPKVRQFNEACLFVTNAEGMERSSTNKITAYLQR